MTGIDELRVGHVMSPAPYCLTDDATLACALKVLGELHLSGAPVLDERGAVVGVISTSDLLGPVEELIEGRLTAGRLERLPLRNFASRPAITIRPEQSLVEACQVMDRAGVHRLVVVNEWGLPVGVLSSWDAVVALSRVDAMAQEATPPERSW